MTRPTLSYKKPSRLVINETTRTRQDDEIRGTLWTRSETRWLEENYGEYTAAECGDELRRSTLAVRIKAHRLGLGLRGDT